MHIRLSMNYMFFLIISSFIPSSSLPHFPFHSSPCAASSVLHPLCCILCAASSVLHSLCVMHIARQLNVQMVIAGYPKVDQVSHCWLWMCSSTCVVHFPPTAVQFTYMYTVHVYVFVCTTYLYVHVCVHVHVHTTELWVTKVNEERKLCLAKDMACPAGLLP